LRLAVKGRALTLSVFRLFWQFVPMFHPNPANRQSTKEHKTYQLLCEYSIPHDDEIQICPKHVEVDW